MNGQRRLGLVAAAATLLATAPLAAIYESWAWLFQCVFAVGLVAGTGMLTRSLRAPLWAQALGMSATLLVVLTLLHGEDALLGLVPTPDTFSGFGGLLVSALDDVRSYGVPVPDRAGLLFVTVLGVGAVAVLIDLLTVSLRRPALAGLPMLAIYSVPVAVYTDDVPPPLFVLGAAGFLWLLVADNLERVRRFGHRFNGEGRGVSDWEPSPMAAAGRRLAVLGVVVAVGLPFAVPDLGTGLLASMGPGGTGPGSGPRTGPASVDLFAELSGRLNQSETQDLLTVTTDEPEPFYLRFAVADALTETGFRPGRVDGDPVLAGMVDPSGVDTEGVSFDRHRATVEITDRFDMPMLPVYSTPVRTDNVGSDWFYDEDAQVIFSGRSRSPGRTYGFEYVRASYDPAALRRSRAFRRDVGPPPETVSVPAVPEVQRLVDELTEDARTDYDRVLAIFNSFTSANGFTYSLETESGTSGSHIVDFLENKSGFCEQYAAAMAWMVRQAGLPARVAFGFANGSDRSGQRYTLTNRNLHAWTEVYFAGFGWVPFDATPSANVPGSVVSEWAPDPNQPDRRDPTLTPSAAPGVGPDASEPALDQEDLGADPGSQNIPGAPDAAGVPWWSIAVPLVVLLLAAPAVRRVLLRRRRESGAGSPTAVSGAAAAGGGGPIRAASVGEEGAPVVTLLADPRYARSRAHAAWDELLDTMVDFGIAVDGTETPRATAQRLASRAALDDRAAAALRLLGHAEERARYAPTPADAAGLPGALRVVRPALAAGAGRRRRLTALVMPPSVLVRWRSQALNLGTAAVLAGGRLRARFSPRRRLIASRAPR